MPTEEEFRARSLRTDAEVDIDEETSQFIVLPVGTNTFACEGGYVREILPHMPITYVPGMPDYFLGMIHSRGELECVVDLAKVIRLGSTPAVPLNRILMARYGVLSSGLLVEYVHDIVDIPKSKISSDVKQTDKERSEFFVGEFIWKEKLVVILDLPLILQRIGGDTA